MWLLFIVWLHFLADKNYFQPFFHWLVLFCLWLLLVVIKCWKYHDAMVHIETRNTKFLVSVPTSSQLNVESYGFSKHRSQFDQFIKRLKKTSCTFRGNIPCPSQMNKHFAVLSNGVMLSRYSLPRILFS